MTFRTSHSLLLAVTLSLTALTCALQAKSFRYVIIDPGHGGHDRGGHHGLVYEKHLALDTGLRLEHYLKSKGIRTKMTRRSDVFISLPGRANYGNRYSNSIFVSVHYNSTWKPDTLGLETYYYGSAGKKLATHVQSSIMRKLRTPNRGVKYARFYVIRHSKHPAILVECGFVTNRRELDRMKKAWFRQSLAEGIGEGILKYKRSR